MKIDHQCLTPKYFDSTQPLAALPGRPIVISGVGIAASLGGDRETVWRNIQAGRSGVRMTRESDDVGPLRLPCAMADCLPPEQPHARSLKSIRLCRTAAAEAHG